MADDSSSISSDNEEQKKTDEPTTIAADIVVTKYKMASEITNRECDHLFEFRVARVLKLFFFPTFGFNSKININE